MTLRIFGEGLDALIFASHLSQNNIEFQWIVTNDRIGGYFRGSRNCFGTPIDIGMVLLEPNSYSSSQLPLSVYQGEWAQNARPYLNASYKTAKKLMGATKRVEVYNQDRSFNSSPDHFISDRLNSFKKNENSLITEQLKENIKWLEKNSQWHPRNKNLEIKLFDSLTIPEYYARIYGDEFYEIFFRSYLENLLGEAVNRLSVSAHRRAWLPLYWPETLIKFIESDDGKEPLFEPIFEKPGYGSVAAWVKTIETEIASSGKAKMIKLEDLEPSEFDYFKSKTDFAFIDENKIAKNSKNKFKASGPYVDLRIIHFCGQIESSEVVFLKDNDYGCFRFTTSQGDENQGGFTLEFGARSSKFTDEELVEISQDFYKELDFRAGCGGKVFKSKFHLNTADDGLKSQNIYDAYNSYTFHHSKNMSINDNIVRGAWASEIIGNDNV
jgi:hypothetical protein